MEFCRVPDNRKEEGRKRVKMRCVLEIQGPFSYI